MTTQDELYTRGLTIRREVLGDQHVQESTRDPNALGAPLQDLVTAFGWGAVWSRPGLDRKTRSLLTIALLVALDKPHELGVHARGGLRNGATEAEIREVILHAAVYCGLPAALAASRSVDVALSVIAP